MADNQLQSRVKKFLVFNRVSNTEFAQLANVTQAYVTSIKQNISFDILKKLYEINPRLNLCWLLWGDGEMLNTNLIEQLKEENERLKRENAYLQKIVALYERNENGTKQTKK